MECSVLVTRSNCGIGLTIVKYLLNQLDPPKILIAACSNPAESKELQELKLKKNNLYLVQLGMNDFFCVIIVKLI